MTETTNLTRQCRALPRPAESASSGGYRYVTHAIVRFPIKSPICDIVVQLNNAPLQKYKADDMFCNKEAGMGTDWPYGE